MTGEHLVGEAEEPVQNYDLLSIVMLCLVGPNSKNYDGVLWMLDVLLLHETSEAEKPARQLRYSNDANTGKQGVGMCNLVRALWRRAWKQWAGRLTKL